MIVRLQIREKDGCFWITSENLPALNVSATGVEAAYASAVRMIKAWYRHSLGFEVEVWPATADRREFPKMIRLCDEVVVQRKPPKAVVAPPATGSSAFPASFHESERL